MSLTHSLIQFIYIQYSITLQIRMDPNLRIEPRLQRRIRIDPSLQIPRRMDPRLPNRCPGLTVCCFHSIRMYLFPSEFILLSIHSHFQSHFNSNCSFIQPIPPSISILILQISISLKWNRHSLPWRDDLHLEESL